MLEGAGLVALAEGEDLRNRLVLLTAQGRQRLQAAAPAWEQAQQQLLEKVGSERRDALFATLELLE
ncbi:hypothetical protein D3C86_2104050 [compost metagenome]